MTVATARQDQGIGQKLIALGLDLLREEGADIAMTCGDPSFYSRVHFKPISEADVHAPFALQHPEAWLGQSLADAPITLAGPARRVSALYHPVFW